VTLRNLMRALVVGALAGMLLVQLLSPGRINPPSQGDLVATPEADAALKRACYDCHSNQTHWPWYSRVAPVSWWIAHDVTLGRREINFSEWGSYYPLTRRRKLQWIGRSLREEQMPPWSYRLMHPGARLTDDDRAALERWIESALSEASAASSHG
jgi:Haem-binding domain